MNFFEGRVAAGGISFDGGGFLEVKRLIPLNIDSKIELGLRPRHIMLSSSAGGAEFVIEGVEPTGDEMEVRGRLFGQSVTVIMDTRPIRIDDKISMVIDQKHVYIFDPANGGRL